MPVFSMGGYFSAIIVVPAIIEKIEISTIHKVEKIRAIMIVVVIRTVMII